MTKKRKTLREESIAYNDARMRSQLREQRDQIAAKIRELKSARANAVLKARYHCAQSRMRLKERAAQLRKQALEEIARLTAPARAACKQRVERARATGRGEVAQLREEQRALRAFEQQVFRAAKKRKRERATTIETDADVRRNIAPELHSLWSTRAAKTKGSARKSRTEEFLQWVEEHPEQVADTLTEASERAVAREIAQHERAQARLAKLLAKPGRLKTAELKAAGVDVSDCSSMDLDCHDPSDLSRYLDSLHASAASEPEPWE